MISPSVGVTVFSFHAGLATEMADVVPFTDIHQHQLPREYLLPLQTGLLRRLKLVITLLFQCKFLARSLFFLHSFLACQIHKQALARARKPNHSFGSKTLFWISTFLRLCGRLPTVHFYVACKIIIIMPIGSESVSQFILKIKKGIYFRLL